MSQSLKAYEDSFLEMVNLVSEEEKKTVATWVDNGERLLALLQKAQV